MSVQDKVLSTVETVGLTARMEAAGYSDVSGVTGSRCLW